MKLIDDQNGATRQTTARPPRAWRLPLFGVLVLAIGVAIIALTSNASALNTIVASEPQVATLAQQADAMTAARQPQVTPAADKRPRGGAGESGAGGISPTDALTVTVSSSESAPTQTLPMNIGVTASAAPPLAAATPTTATPTTARAVGVVAVAGANGATLYAPDGIEQLHTVSVGGRMLLTGRSEDGAWLRVQTDDGVGWVRRTDVVVFNVNRLGIIAAAPPAETTPIPGHFEITPASSEATITPDAGAIDAGAIDAGAADAALPAVAPATTAAEEPTASSVGDPDQAPTDEAPTDRTVVTASLDVSKAKGLNIRSGPGAAYARVGAIAAQEALTVTGRNHTGDWLAVESADGALRGWAAAYYLNVTGDSDQLPEIQSAPAAMETPSVETSATTAPASAQPTEKSTSTASAATAAVQGRASTDLDGTLVFQTGQGGAIYAYDLTSGKLWPLTTGFDPAISPDGSTVAFSRNGEDGGLYLIDIDGGNERRIYTGPRIIASPKWSSDGAQIAFNYSTSARECRDIGNGACISDDQFASRRYRDLDPNDYPLTTVYTYDIGVIDANGANFRSLSSLGSARALDWGASGIVYQSSDGIQRMSAQGGASSVLLFDPLRPVDQDPSWVDAGIVFQRPGASHWQIWRADVNGANAVALTQPQTVLVKQLPSSVAPAASPDGRQIVFLSNRTDSGEAGDWRLWVMNADGSNQRPLPIAVPIRYTFGAEQMVSWGP